MRNRIDDAPAPRRSRLVLVLVGCSALLGLLLCGATIGLTLWILSEPAWLIEPDADPTAVAFLPTPTATVGGLPTALPTATQLPTPTATVVAPAPTTTTPPDVQPTAAGAPFDVPDAIVQATPDAEAWDGLAAFWRADPPPYDYYEVARGLRYDVGPRTVAPPPAVAGDRREFRIDDRRLMAELVAQGENSSLWVEDGYDADSRVLQTVAQRIDRVIYPRVRDLFGEEWRPGVDGDTRINILHVVSVENFSEIGFFSSVNQYPQTLDENSNELEIVFLNMEQLTPGDDLYYATVAHELVHLIQWNLDPNEEVWLDEGLGQLAELVLGYDTAETIDYVNNPQTSLTNWGYDEAVVYDHYAAGFLFATYLWEQLGDDAIRDLMLMPDNGLNGVRRLLAVYRPQTTLEQFLGEWAVANLLDDPDGDARYGYRALDPLLPEKVVRIRSAPYDTVNTLAQFGVDYIDLRATGTLTVTFAGDTTADLLPQPPTGTRAWYAPSGTDLAAHLTRGVDLRAVDRATLEYWAWYDLEADYDYAYVEASDDGGATWDVLSGDAMVDGFYGPAYSGRSQDRRGNVNGWVREAIPLDDYAGGELLLRFHVLSDGAYIERGFAVDDITIAEIGVRGDADGATDGWQAAGFLTVGARLPQQWTVLLVQDGRVLPIALDANNRARWAVTLDEPATIVIMPQTPGIVDGAAYWLNVSAP